MKKVTQRILRLPLGKRAEMAFKEAVAEVIEEHARLGLPLYVGRNGKVIKVSARDVSGKAGSNGK